MIRSLIQIADGEVQDFFKAFGFIYLDADERTAPDEKEDAVSNYAEQEGENRDGRTVDAAFDYKAKFLIEAPNYDLTNVNVKVNDFNRTIREYIKDPNTGKDTDLKRKKVITFYNLLNRVKIVGLPDVIAVPTECYNSTTKGVLEFAEVELKIRVTSPSKCDFELKTDNL